MHRARTEETVRVVLELYNMFRAASDVFREWQQSGDLDDRTNAIDEALRIDAERREQLQRLAKKADKRAEMLLLKYLTPEQAAEYHRSKFFHTIGQDGAVFRIEKASCRSVVRVMGGRDVERYCLVPQGMHIPDPDLMLVCKLLLESSQDLFMSTANREVVR